MESADIKNELLGAWHLKSYSVKKQNNHPLPLWGEYAGGLLIYLPNGYMSVQVSNKDRPAFEKGDFLAGSIEEITSAFEGYTAYYGKFEYQPDNQLVCHYVDQSVFPNWCGVTHKRYVELSNSQLTLSTPPILINGELCTMQMFWQRIS
jgi:hypothetical protein